jgi:hypothetical protein
LELRGCGQDRREVLPVSDVNKPDNKAGELKSKQRLAKFKANNLR